MAFTDKLKQSVREKAFFRCVICHQPFVEVHHIIPQEDNGPDTEDNAAPLCAGCHDLYGGNPEKRKQIKQMRDQWYKEVEKMCSNQKDLFKEIRILNSQDIMLQKNGVAIYHVVFKNEDFNTSAQMIIKLLKSAQQTKPGFARYLYIDVEGHRNSKGGFDRDMFELLSKFMAEVLMKYLIMAYTPFGKLVNSKSQSNDIPDFLEILG